MCALLVQLFGKRQTNKYQSKNKQKRNIFSQHAQKLCRLHCQLTTKIYCCPISVWMVMVCFCNILRFYSWTQLVEMIYNSSLSEWNVFLLFHNVWYGWLGRASGKFSFECLMVMVVLMGIVFYVRNFCCGTIPLRLLFMY